MSLIMLRVFSLVAVAICVFAAPVSAQASIVDLLPGFSSANVVRDASGDGARLTANQYARCVVKHMRARVIVWLKASTDDERRQLIPSTFPQNCLRNGQLEVPLPILRGSLYNALYREDFERRPIVLRLQPLQPSQVPAAGPDPNSQKFGTLITFGDCLVRKDPEATRRLVLANAGSVAESQALSSLEQFYSSCLVAGTQMSLSKSVLASVLAEALYLETAHANGASANSVSESD